MGLFNKNKNKNTNKVESNRNVTLEDGTTITSDVVVDCIGDSCPRPQLMTKSAFNKAMPGDIIVIDIDNPTSMEALPPMMVELNGTHIDTLFIDKHWEVILKKN
jgi:tRNA 2-thiouridine synthesizing protein A